MKILRSSIFSFKKGSIALSHQALVVYVLVLGALIAPKFMHWPSLCNRALECASLFRTVAGPFHGGFSSQQYICGDLALMANRTDLCSWRSEVFQTDKWGFRNSPGAEQAPVVVFGDSFAYGQGVSQNDMPSAVLGRLVGGAYNAAGIFQLNHLKWVLDHVTLSAKTVVYFHLERHHHRPEELKEWSDELMDSWWGRAKIQLGDLAKYNPLKIFFADLEKKYFIPWVFPNRYDHDIPHGTLRNGKEFLFLKSSVDQFNQVRAGHVLDEGGFFEGLRDLLSKRGIKLIVALIPEKYTIYAPYLKAPPPQKVGFYLNDLDRELTRRSVQVVNLLPILQKDAEDIFAEGEYNYWPDDTHWNAQGIWTSAQAIFGLLKK